MKRLLAILLLLIALPVTAADAYFCRCDTGANASCATNVGNNGNSGATSSLPKLDIPANASGFNAGDTMFLCTGGSWLTVNGFVDTTNFTPTSPFKINWYVPPSGCTGGCATAKPILSCTATDCNVIAFGIGGTATHKDGLSISNVALDCSAATGLPTGLFINGDSNYLTVDTFTITGCSIGVLSQGILSTIGTSDGMNDYLTFRNFVISNATTQGFLFDPGSGVMPLGNSTHVLIENGTLNNVGNRDASGHFHPVYFNGGTDVVVRGLTITNTANFGGTGCSSTTMVLHGYIRRLVFEDNLIQETAAVDPAGGCYGIQANSVLNNGVQDNIADVIIRGNRVVNIGSIGIATTGCLRCLIENNHLVWTQNTALDRIGISAQAGAIGTDPDTLGGVVTMRNNSCFIASANLNSICYQSKETGSGHTMVSNVAYFDAASASTATCFDYGTKTSSDFGVSGASSGYNSCFRTGGATFSNKGNLATTQGLGFDANSITSDPTLTATPGAGTNWEIRFSNGTVTNAGHPSLSSRLGYRGKIAVGARDMGACEYTAAANECSSSSTSVLSSPVQSKLQ
jgi:hypothetical protein